MNTPAVHINFEILSQTVGHAMLRLAREKAAKANSTIVYKKDNVLIEENPATGEIKILKEYTNEQSS